MSKKYLETIKSLDGKLYHLTYHQQRLEEVLKSLDGVKTYNLEELLNPPKKGLYRCRVVYSESSIDIEYIFYKKQFPRTLKLVYNDEIEYSKKYEDRTSLNELLTLKASCDDILIVKGGLISDTSIANIAFFNGREWVTPKRPLLKGTTRARYLQTEKIIVQDIFVDDINKFTKVALMNAMIDFDIIAEENIEDVIC